MSAAWEGYQPRGRQRPQAKRRRWLAAAGVLLVLLPTVFALQQCLPQGELSYPRNAAALARRQAMEDNPAAAALVIYNENDPLSHDLADFYASKRGIPPERVVGLKCSINEEISRAEYDATIAGPLRALFDARGWWTRSPDQATGEPTSVVSSNRIRFLVLLRGMPLRISEASGYAGDTVLATQPTAIATRNAAAVDSELAVLGLFTHHLSGVIGNPYYRSYDPFLETHHAGMMLVGRLDAPTGGMVRRMIEDALAVEKTGLWGRCYIDGRGLPPGDSLSEGDAWLRKIATEITPFALPTIYDNAPALFAADYPLTEAALYFGWYSEQPAGALADENFHFRPGAVACHIHSFSATSVRDPSRWWVGPLLSKGAAAVLGNVYEPYLSLTTHLDIFADRLCGGLTFIESAYAATPALSWMNTFVGDPLYRPCGAWKNLEFDLNAAAPVPGPDSAVIAAGRAYYKGAQTWRAEGAGPGAKALGLSAGRLHDGRIYEGLGLLQMSGQNVPAARAAFAQAAHSYRAPADQVRAILDEANALVAAQQKPAAIEVLESGRRKLGTTGMAAIFGETEAQIGVDSPAPAKP